MSEELLLWHDFNVSLVTAAAGLLGLLFVALSLHLRVLNDEKNAELRAVARTIFIGYVISLGVGFFALFPQSLNAYGIELLALNLAAVVPFVNAAGRGLRAQGVGYRRSVTVTQFIAGLALIVTTIVASLDIAASDPHGLAVMAGIAVVSLIWGVFNTWELIFRVAKMS